MLEVFDEDFGDPNDFLGQVRGAKRLSFPRFRPPSFVVIIAHVNTNAPRGATTRPTANGARVLRDWR